MSADGEYMCPLCYLGEKERRAATPFAPRPKRTRELMTVQQRCKRCGRRTFWRALGWWIVKNAKEPL